MNFVSLGEEHHKVSFGEALRQGTAPDGSLYFPERIPVLPQESIDRLKNADIVETARIMLSPWLEDEIPPADLDVIIDQAATFATPLRAVGKKQVLELFHGPTLAFKDVAARYLASLMSYYNSRDGYTFIVLVATSGDTGGAIAHGFADISSLKVAILFPKDRVSELQREQLTRTANNVQAYEIDGTFDDCQQMVKQALGDATLADLHLSSANSINVGRLVPQVIYYANAWGQLSNDNAGVRFVVPTGNLGNLTAGLLAQRMGIPIKSFLAANNRNDALTRYLETGQYEPRNSITTLSNAMDVGAPNNLPRFVKIFDGDVQRARQLVSATVVSDEETIDTMKKVYADHGYLLDPHTAVAWTASERIQPEAGVQDVIVSTASPIKFSKEILKATGIELSNGDELAALQARPERVEHLPNSYQAFAEKLRSL